MKYSARFQAAKEMISKQIDYSKTIEDPSHAANTMHWVQKLRPDADELLLLAGFGHDIERSQADRYRHTDFSSYDEYKKAHATRGGKLVGEIMLKSGYAQDDAVRVAHIIAEGEFNSEDPDIQLLCDADSISYFDNNLPYYLKEKGEKDTRMKVKFMYERMTDRAQKYAREILGDQQRLHLLED